MPVANRQYDIPLRKRLSFRLFRNVAIAVLVLECLLALGQISIDYSIQKDALEETATQLLNTVEDAATHVLWTLDREGGTDLLNGLLRYNAIARAELTDAEERVFTAAEKDSPHSSSFARWIFGGYRTFEKSLSEALGDDPPEYVGSVRMTFDSSIVGADFFKRTIAYLLTGLIMNLVLAAILLYVFHSTMARSILSVGDALSRVNPKEPGVFRIPLPKRHRQDELGVLVNKTNDLLGAVGENIQKRLKAEEELQRLNRELEQRVEDRTRELRLANQEMEAFSYSVSHDLRGPVRGIEGLCTALLEDYGGRLDGEGEKCLRLLKASSSRMDSLINGLLTLSQSSQGGLTPEDVDLSALVRESVRERRSANPERDVDAVVAAGVHVFADRRLISVVVENLIGNAWKYSAGSAPAVIEFGVGLRDGQPVYHVRDNGAGFDMSQVGRLFKPFQRLHNKNDFEGTGIGLATVGRIIRRHAGKIWAESEIGKGATFYFTLGLDESYSTEG